MEDRAQQLVGRRFVADLRVVAVEPRRAGVADADRMVTLHLHGDTALLSLGELEVLVGSGIVSEVPLRGF